MEKSLTPFCPICGSVAAEKIVAMDAMRFEKFKIYSERKYGGLLDSWPEVHTLCVTGCKSCGHFWLLPQPDETQLFAMYAAGRPWDGNVLRTAEPTLLMRKEMRRLRHMVGSVAQPTLLDFGSGSGRWSRAAAAEGFAVTAFEPSFERGRGAQNSPFETVQEIGLLEGRCFDVVNVEQVLEHVKDPLATLRQIGYLAMPDAICRLTVPNVLRAKEGARIWLDWPFDGKGAHTLAPFEHLQGFTPNSLKAAVRYAGLEPIGEAKSWRYAPINRLRRLVGNVVPLVGHTLLYARPAKKKCSFCSQ